MNMYILFAIKNETVIQIRVDVLLQYQVNSFYNSVCKIKFLLRFVINRKMGPISKIIFWMMCFLCIVTPFLEAARILAIISLPSYSHQVAYQLLWTTLSRRGHELVVLTTDPVNDPSITNLTEIDFHYNYKEIKSASFVKTMEQSRWINLERNQFFNISHVLTENIYKHSEVRKMYAPDSDQKFDAVIIEIIKTPGLYSLAHRFNAPLIGKSNDKII